MAWFDLQGALDYFGAGGGGAIQAATDVDDWLGLVWTEAKRLDSSLKMTAKAALQVDGRAYFKEVRENGLTDDFATWMRRKYAPVAKAVSPLAASKPPVLKGVAPPNCAGEDVPSFSSEAVTADCAVGAADPARPKMRIRLKFHLLPNEWAKPDELEKWLKKRTLKWVRRVYAQANLAPRLDGIETITSLPANTLSVLGVKVPGYHVPKLPTGLTPGGLASRITLVLTDDADVAETVTVALTDKQTTEQIASTIATELSGKGYTVTGPTRHLSDAKHHSSHDLVLAKGGKPLKKIVATHDDAEFGQLEGKPYNADVGNEVLEVPVLSPAKGMDDEDGLHGGTPLQRMLLRLGVADDDQIDIYVLPKGSINGRAYPVYDEWKGTPMEPPAPYRNAAYVTYWSTGAKGVVLGEDLEVSPFTLPHEIGHVLGGTAHTEAESCLMHGGWSKDNGAQANKRIYSAPLLVGSIEFRTERDRARQDVSAEMRTRGNKRILVAW
jgi:hypothetical protein